MIYFRCRECGAMIKVSRHYAGKKGKCSHCGATNEIPAQSEAPAAAVSGAPAGLHPPGPAGENEKPSAESGALDTAGEDAPDAAARDGRAKRRKSAGKGPASRARRRPGGLPVPARQVDGLLARLRRRKDAGLFNVLETAAYIIGVYAVLGLGVVLLAVGLAMLATETRWGWSRSDRTRACLELIVLAALMPLCQYVIAKLRAASTRIVRSSPSSVASTGLLDCLAVLAVVGAAAAAPTTARTARQSSRPVE
ncbi:MAG: hypothetical protein J7M21_00800, partial [Planctomycetes bacterium]|nr:hypothetical protein [Planctomycetota bacterium]